MAFTVGTLAAGFGLACSSHPPVGATAPLDCAWLASDNCWQTALAAAARCLPTGEIGMLGDNANAGKPLPLAWRACVYAGGAKVTFRTPLPEEITPDTKYDFTIANGGRDCVHVESAGAGLKVVVGGQTVTVELDQGFASHVSCEGVTYSVPDPLSVASCKGVDGGSPFALLPGSVVGPGTPISFGLAGMAGSSQLLSELELFRCTP